MNNARNISISVETLANGFLVGGFTSQGFASYAVQRNFIPHTSNDPRAELVLVMRDIVDELLDAELAVDTASPFEIDESIPF